MKPCTMCRTPTDQIGAYDRRAKRWCSEYEVEHYQSDAGYDAFGPYPPPYQPLCPACVGKATPASWTPAVRAPRRPARKTKRPVQLPLFLTLNDKPQEATQ